MATQELKVKFSSDGISQVQRDSATATKSYTDFLDRAQQAMKAANIAAEQAQGNAAKVAAADAARAKAAEVANRAVAASFRELRVKSEQDIEQQKTQAISAFEAIKKSGVASASDIARAEENLQRRLQQLDAQLATTERQAKQTGEGFTILKGAVASFLGNAAFAAINQITNALQGVAGNIVQVGASAERQAVAFETFLGSAEKAKTLLADLRKFAATTPFELPEVTEAAKTLAAKGVEVNQIIPTIKRLGEIAAGADKPLNQLLFVYGQIKDQGRAMGQDLNQLTNAGISIGDIAKALNIGTGEVRDFVSQGKFGFAELEKVIVSVTSEGGRFNGLMDKLGGTTAVKLSNLNDAFTKIYQAAYDKLSPALSTVLDVLNKVLDDIATSDFLAPLTESMQRFADYAKSPDGVAELSKNIRGAISDLITVVGALAKIFTELLPIVGSVSKAIADNITVVKALFAALAGWIVVSKLIEGFIALRTAIVAAQGAMAAASVTGLAAVGPAGWITLAIGAVAALALNWDKATKAINGYLEAAANQAAGSSGAYYTGPQGRQGYVSGQQFGPFTSTYPMYGPPSPQGSATSLTPQPTTEFGGQTVSTASVGGGGAGAPSDAPILYVLKPTGRTDPNGLAEMALYLSQDNQVIDVIPARSGVPSRQNFRTPQNWGALEPIPEGKYSIGAPEFASGKFGDFSKNFPDKLNGLGGFWADLISKNPATAGVPFGFHPDNNINISPGSAGCVVFLNNQDALKFAEYRMKGGPADLIVDYGLGTVPRVNLNGLQPKAPTLNSKQQALIQAAKLIGMPPEWLAAIISRESNFDPNKWGGAGGDYFGLIQFGANERKDYGINPSQRQQFEQQILGPVVQHFKSRGFRPGMSLAEAYATVLGGNPRAVNSSDGNGSPIQLAKTDLAPGGGSYQAGLAFLGGQSGLAASGFDPADIINAARQRADAVRQQANQQATQVLEDQQQQRKLQLDKQLAGMPDGGAKDALQLRISALDKEFQLQKETLQIRQTIAQLESERSRKVQDGTDDGKDYTAQINFLNKRLTLLNNNYQTEKQILSLQFNARLGQQSQAIDKQLEGATQSVEQFKAALADQTPEEREQQAIAQATKQYDDVIRALDETKKSIEEQIKTRLELNWNTKKELDQLNQLEDLYNAVNYLRGASADITKVQFEAQEKLNKAQRQSDLKGLEKQIAEAQAAQLEGRGDLRGANNLRRDAAIAELRAQQAVRLAELRAQQAATTDPGAIAYLDAIIARTQTLNDLQLQQVTQQYDTLYQRISQVSQGIASAVSEGLGNLINGLLEGTKSFGDTVLGVLGGILQQIGQMFLQFALQQLQNQIFKSLFGLIGGAFGGGFGGGGGLGGIGNLFGFAGFAEGGSVYGPGTETSDSIPVRLSRGEFVTRASAVRTVGPEFMHRINAAKSLTEAHQAMAAELMGMAAGGLAEEMFEAAGHDIYRQVTLGAVDLGRSPSVRRGGAIVANINITTPNPDGFRPSERQIGQKVLDQVRRGMSRA